MRLRLVRRIAIRERPTKSIQVNCISHTATNEKQAVPTGIDRVNNKPKKLLVRERTSGARFFISRALIFGEITTIGLVISLFFLGSKHGAGAFLPGIICGLAADGIAHLGHYKDKVKNLLSFLVFAFGTTGPILLMWLTPQAYIATLVARGKSQDYIDRIMVAPNPANILLFITSVLIGALLGALIGQTLSKKLAHKTS